MIDIIGKNSNDLNLMFKVYISLKKIIIILNAFGLCQ